MFFLRPPSISTTLRLSRPALSRSLHVTRPLWQAPLPKNSIKDTKDTKDPFTELENEPRRPPTSPAPTVKPVEKKHTKAHAILAKLPGPFRKYGERLVDAPFAHVSAFLILHEFTALVPFLGLWYAFHTYEFLPADIPSWMIVKSTGVIERILGDTVANYSLQDRARLIVEGATAYGLVKATFPLRVVFSLFLTPWFARIFVSPSLRGLKRLGGMIRGKKSAAAKK